jgi:hypothetical protein
MVVLEQPAQKGGVMLGDQPNVVHGPREAVRLLLEAAQVHGGEGGAVGVGGCFGAAGLGGAEERADQPVGPEARLAEGAGAA